MLTDDNSDPGGDTARLRLVHASPDAPAVDVTAESTGDVLYDGVAYGESGYVEVPANDYTVQVRGDTEGDDGDVVADFDVNLAGGQVYTAFAAGYLSPDDEPADTPFDLVVAQDTEQTTDRTPRPSEGTPLHPSGRPARFRAARERPDSPRWWSTVIYCLCNLFPFFTLDMDYRQL